MDLPSPRPRRVAPPRWLNPRLVLGLVLVLASVVAGARLLAGARHTERAVAVRGPLAAGSVLRPGELTYVRVQLPDGGRGYVRNAADAAGKRLNRPIGPGELLPSSALGTAPELTTLTVEFEQSRAPQLRAGQRIEVWLSTPSCLSAVLLADVTVQDVDTTDSGIGAGRAQDVVLTIAPVLADRVVSALAGKDAVLRAGVRGGARPDRSGPDPNADLPALYGRLATDS